MNELDREEVLRLIRSAFDSDVIAKKNLALRNAHDFIVRPTPVVDDVVERACEAYHKGYEAYSRQNDDWQNCHRAAMRAALAAAQQEPPAKQEPVAWRYRYVDWPEWRWSYVEKKPTAEDAARIDEPLYAAAAREGDT